MIPYKYVEKQDQESVKLSNIEKAFTTINEFLRNKNIPIFNTTKKDFILLDLCEYLFENYLDNEQFKLMGFDIDVNIEGHCACIYQANSKFITNETPVGTFTIKIIKFGEVIKSFNYVIGDFR